MDFTRNASRNGATHLQTMIHRDSAHDSNGRLNCTLLSTLDPAFAHSINASKSNIMPKAPKASLPRHAKAPSWSMRPFKVSAFRFT